MAKQRNKDTVIVHKEALEEMQRIDTDEIIDKAATLSVMLTYTTIDDEKTLFGSEPVYVPVFNKEEQKSIKEKLFKLIERF